MDEVERLIAELQDPQKQRERSRIADRLGTLKDVRALPIVVEMLNDEDQRFRHCAAKDIRNIAEANPGNESVVSAAPKLVEVLKVNGGDSDEDSHLRLWAASALATIAKNNQTNPEMLGILPDLMELLNHESIITGGRESDILECVMSAVLYLGAPVIPILSEAVSSEKSELAENIVMGLKRWIGWKPDLTDAENIKVAVPVLACALSRDGHTAELAAETLEKISSAIPDNAELVNIAPKLVLALHHSNFGVVNPISKVLSNIGVNAIPAIDGAFVDDKPGVRLQAVVISSEIALAKPETIGTLLPLLITRAREDADNGVRNSSGWAIANIASVYSNQPAVLNAIPAFEEMLESEIKGMRKFSAEVIRRIAKANPGDERIIHTIPKLAKLLGERDKGVKCKAAETIGEIAKANPGNPELAKAVPQLTKALNAKDGKVRIEAAQAMVHVANSIPETELRKPKMAMAIATMIDGLKDSKGEVRQEATKMLTTIAEKIEINLALVGGSFAEYVRRVGDTGSPEEVIAAQKEAAELYSRIASAASKRIRGSVEMAGELLRPCIRPITPRGWNPGMLRMQGMGRTQMQEGRRMASA